MRLTEYNTKIDIMQSWALFMAASDVSFASFCFLSKRTVRNQKDRFIIKWNVVHHA